jgi:hypothetical protein
MLTNAELGPDPRTEGTTDCMLVPVEDIEALRVFTMTRAELVEYLEGRGFAVYENEPTEELREAARLDMMEES